MEIFSSSSKCFEEFFIHKFRSTISKSNVFGRGEHVLIAYSGGPSSTALLHLIVDGLSMHARRRFQFQPHVAFIDGDYIFQFYHFVESKIFRIVIISRFDKYS